MMGVFTAVFKLLQGFFAASSVEAPFTLLGKPARALFFPALEFPRLALGLLPEVPGAVDALVFVGKGAGALGPPYGGTRPRQGPRGL